MGVQPNPVSAIPAKPEFQWFRCPRCGGENARWSRRSGWFEHVVGRLLVLRPFRCKDCRKRRYLFLPTGWVVDPHTLRMVIYFGLAFVLATVVYVRITSQL